MKSCYGWLMNSLIIIWNEQDTAVTDVVFVADEKVDVEGLMIVSWCLCYMLMLLWT